jgi:hypothetical protein
MPATSQRLAKLIEEQLPDDGGEGYSRKTVAHLMEMAYYAGENHGLLIALGHEDPDEQKDKA